MRESELFFLLSINRMRSLKSVEKIILAERVKNLEELLLLGIHEIEGLVGRRLKCPDSWEDVQRKVEKDMKHLTSGKIGCTFYWDKDYPPLLRKIYDPPYMLFYRGTLPDNKRIHVAIVGTRKSHAEARKAARKLAEEWVLAGGIVVSGIAFGIDAEAHMGSLARKDSAVAVLGNGIDLIYPVSNRWLGRKILHKGGALLSEYPPGEPPAKYHFPERNRIISGLSEAVVVVEAPERSGALITADYALEQGRELLVHRLGLSDQAALGTRKLAEEGAGIVENCYDILKQIGKFERDLPGFDFQKLQAGNESSENNGKSITEGSEADYSAASKLVTDLRREMKAKGLLGDFNG